MKKNNLYIIILVICIILSALIWSRQENFLANRGVSNDTVARLNDFIGKTGSIEMKIQLLEFQQALIDRDNLALERILLYNLFIVILIGFGSYALFKITRSYTELKKGQTEQDKRENQLVNFSNTIQSMAESIKNKEQKIDQVQKNIREVERYNENILECITSGVIVIDADGNITRTNRSARAVFGSFFKQIDGKNISSFFQTPFSDFGMFFKECIDNRKSIRNHEIVIQLNSETKYFGMTTSRMIGENGSFSGVVAIFKDISDIKEMENQVLRTERLSSLYTLSAGLSHEINNPISIILATAQSVIEDCPQTSEYYESLKVIEKHSLRCAALIKSLLDFARLKPADSVDVDINMAVSDSIDMIKLEKKSGNIEFEYIQYGGKLVISADPALIRQVFYNIIKNGIEAMNDSGKLRVYIQKTGEEAAVFIKDSGPGIPGEIIGKIFDPFYTSKKTGGASGCGLGLSIANRIVERYHGRILVSSVEGEYTEFIVKLPIRREDV